MPTTVQPAVVGATGYTGAELTRLLLKHPRSRTPLLFHDRDDDTAADFAELYPQFGAVRNGSPQGTLPIERLDWERVQRAGVDVLFLCTPHEVSRRLVPHAVARGLRVIDLSGAWRLKQTSHRAVYAFEDENPQAASALDASAAYGIPELRAAAIAEARVVANAGCYATSIILALAAWIDGGLLDLSAGVVCDSKSGVSGAGKAATARTHFVEVSDNFSAYNVFGHRHTGEVLEQLGLERSQLQFTPHLLPIPRGIFSSIYVRAKNGTRARDLDACLREFYSEAPFVRVRGSGKLPEIRYTLHTNYCDIGFEMEPEGSRVLLVSCLDNLVKGASGQAVQNFNVMCGFDQREGLQ
jgi:N-acetyl-gamma-glutamyl-phosphate reductase